VRDMTDKLLAARGGGRIGVHWSRNLVKRRDSLTTQLLRAYNRQGASFEDLVPTKSWFQLVEQAKANYGTLDEDV
jgi:hypothetical protein